MASSMLGGTLGGKVRFCPGETAWRSVVITAGPAGRLRQFGVPKFT
jgi:hypothetical protein